MTAPDLDRVEVARALDAPEPQMVAETAVELVLALFAADVASLWWFREELAPRLVARSPRDADESALRTVIHTEFRVDDLGRWTLVLGWRGTSSPQIPEGALERFVAQLEATLLRATERKMREESHLELTDNVAQALVVANTLYDMGDTEGAQHAVARALEHTKEVMGRLQRDDPQQNFVRLYPSSVEVLDPALERPDRAIDDEA